MHVYICIYSVHMYFPVFSLAGCIQISSAPLWCVSDLSELGRLVTEHELILPMFTVDSIIWNKQSEFMSHLQCNVNSEALIRQPGMRHFYMNSAFVHKCTFRRHVSRSCAHFICISHSQPCLVQNSVAILKIDFDVYITISCNWN